MGLYAIPCRQCGKGFLWFSDCLDQRCAECRPIPPETLRLAEEALKRTPLTEKEAMEAGVNFILNCPLGGP